MHTLALQPGRMSRSAGYATEQHDLLLAASSPVIAAGNQGAVLVGTFVGHRRSGLATSEVSNGR